LFWLGLRDAMKHLGAGRSFACAITQAMKRPIELAAKIMAMKTNMPYSKLQELRSRLLNGNYLEPILFEVDTAAHFWQLGYEVEWVSSSVRDGVRSPEFIARSEHHELEVECKHQSADSGRRVIRPKFYRLVDALLDPVSSRGLVGKILITVPGRIPTSEKWKRDVVQAVSSSIRSGAAPIRLADGTEITRDLHNVRDLIIPASDLQLEISRLQTPYAHFVIRATRDATGTINALIVRLSSQSDDSILDSIFEDLKDANKQLTGQRAALISCFVPEIRSFKGLQSNSALAHMTYTFFENHASPHVYAVSYTSDIISFNAGLYISESMPAIVFRNHKYDSRFGTEFPIMAQNNDQHNLTEGSHD
jgi:hypothetical protein